MWPIGHRRRKDLSTVKQIKYLEPRAFRDLACCTSIKYLLRPLLHFSYPAGRQTNQIFNNANPTKIPPHRPPQSRTIRNPRAVSMGSKKRSPQPPAATTPGDVGAPPAGKGPVAAVVPRPPDVAPFLTKVYDMISDPATDAVISWSAGAGASFVIWDSHAFERDLLPRHFKHNHFTSFIRQLNTYVRSPHPSRALFIPPRVNFVTSYANSMGLMVRAGSRDPTSLIWSTFRLNPVCLDYV
jgi:hypothetical protein